MKIVQDTFYIPEDISIRLATGEYFRKGGVVRQAIGSSRGQIVKHLEPVTSEITESVKKGIAENKMALVIAGIGFLVGGSVIYAWNYIKKQEPKEVNEFKKALRNYIDSIRSGTMNINKINELMLIIDIMKNQTNYKKINIQLTIEEMEILVGYIYEYTIKLAHDNDVELNKEELNAVEIKDIDTMSNLQKYLIVQKNIFSKAA